MTNDDTVRFNGHMLRLLLDSRRAGYARATVECQERQDGSVVVVH